MNAREATLAVCEAWERGDPDAVADLFAEDGRYEDPLMPGALAVGPDAIREAVTAGMGELAGVRIPFTHLIGDGDVAICEAEFRSELASGEGRLDFPFAMVIEMRDGRIARLAEFFDTRPLVP